MIFILVNPAVPENIGLSLRALNTMGFSEMRIVGTINKEADGLRKTAYGSHDLLESIVSYPDLRTALEDIDLTVGTTAKKRTTRKDPVPVAELADLLRAKGDTSGKVAIVFGSEENGLHKDEIDLCDIVSTIPLATNYPSLNLAQSVLIYAYELSGLDSHTKKKSPGELTHKKMMQESEELMKFFEFDRSPTMYRRMLDRISLAGDVDTRLILSVIKKVKRLISKRASSR